MTTTVEIPDGLLDRAKQFAQTHDLTLDEVVEEGLRKAMDEEKAPAKPFRLPDGSFGGGGMLKDFTWPEILDIIYEGRGA
jgi:hypothetical protein